jgi:F-type H+-transporting ATPase subunit b
MPIDWFTVGAQTLNFLILVWLLKRFLYKPILNGLDTREQKIKNILANADHTQHQAEELRAEFEQKSLQIDQQRSDILKLAQQEAIKDRQQLFDNAQQAADDMLKKRLESLQSELQNLRQDIVRKNIEEVYAISRKTLVDLADINIEQAMLDRLLKHFEALKTDQYNELVSALDRANNEVIVRSAFALSSKQIQSIQQCLDNKLSPKGGKTIQLTFSLVPELINGIELTFSGWKLAWSANNYLQTLQHRVTELSSIRLPRPKFKDLPEDNVEANVRS